MCFQGYCDVVLCKALSGANCQTGKYDGKDSLPQGPRAALFKQILPGAQPLLAVMQEVAEARGKTVPQVGLFLYQPVHL